MISLAEIKREAAGAGVDVAIIEKDYVLSWVLKGIFESSLADSLVFKGGTALRKMYFEKYRFSEDLDFTIKESPALTDLKAGLLEVCDMISKASDLELGLAGIKQTRLETNEEAFEGKIEYVGPRQHRGSPSRIKLDVTAYEQIFLPIAQLPLIHSYSDRCQAKVSVYQLDEILAEKIRTIIQRSYPRDLYDAWYILKFHRDMIDTHRLISAYLQKCAFKNVQPVEWESFFRSSAILNKETAFARSLKDQLKALPTFDELTTELAEILIDLSSND